MLPGGSLRGQVELAQSSPQVTMRVTDAVGQLVREMPLGTAPAGRLDFSWDGTNNTGGYAPPGRYTVRIEAIQNDRTVDLQTQLYAKVESVNMNSRDGLTLNLEGLGPIAFNNVKQIY
jgi:flagellar basal-body rod modification protein FlgD